MFGWILLVVGAVIVLWVISAYNGLIALKNQTFNAFKQIDVQLKRRHDLIPNLVNAVRGAMEFERDTLTQVMEARNRAMAATSPADAARREGELTQALGRLFAVAENYPTLRANENVKMLQEELTTTENKVGFARQFYNDEVLTYNNVVQQFPSSIVASIWTTERASSGAFSTASACSLASGSASVGTSKSASISSVRSVNSQPFVFWLGSPSSVARAAPSRRR